MGLLDIFIVFENEGTVRRRRRPGLTGGRVVRIIFKSQDMIEQALFQRAEGVNVGQREIVMFHPGSHLKHQIGQDFRKKAAPRRLYPKGDGIDEQPHHLLDTGDFNGSARYDHAEDHILAIVCLCQ